MAPLPNIVTFVFKNFSMWKNVNLGEHKLSYQYKEKGKVGLESHHLLNTKKMESDDGIDINILGWICLTKA